MRFSATSRVFFIHMQFYLNVHRSSGLQGQMDFCRYLLMVLIYCIYIVQVVVVVVIVW